MHWTKLLCKNVYHTYGLYFSMKPNNKGLSMNVPYLGKFKQTPFASPQSICNITITNMEYLLGVQVPNNFIQ